MNTLRRWWADERGDSGPLEVVILTPVLVFILFLVVAFGRATTAENNLTHAARVAARAAVTAQTFEAAQVRATAVATDTLTGSGMHCASTSTTITGNLEPGGRITVTVACVVSLDDVNAPGLALAGSKTLAASATEVVDRTRGGPTP